ncbi:30S ribosomal protein S8 [Candidatus Wolfebacteria bacterium]|nr:30S ribosomal protein S8 [Candidatus Wolfebacteria bacterium]
MYINLLTQLKNAQAVKKENIKTLYSKTDESVLKILTNYNYIDGFEKKGQKIKRFLDIKLKYSDGVPAINGIKLISKPSRKIYIGYEKIKPVKHGYGLFVISTPKGIMSGQDARKNKIGGEALFTIW